MADTSWTQISGYTPQDYTDTLVFEMSAETKKLEKIVGQALVAGEENSQYIKFVLPRYWDGIDISGKTFGIEYALAGTYYGTSEAVNAEMSTDQVRFGWIVPKNACAISGTLFFVLKVDDTDYVLKSQIADTPVFKTIDVGDVVPEPTKEQWYREFAARVEGAIDNAEAAIEAAQAAQASAEAAAQNAQAAEDNAEAAAATAQIRYGSPLTAAEADQMIDENRVYVYTGSESGYTAGNWYYYDGSAWVSGGVYNSSAVNTDTTLTQAGMAADAKATGDKINSIVNSAYVTDSASGSISHFTDGADDVPMKSLKVNIVPAQSGSGDPSPDNVRPITGFDSVKVTRAGKNVFDNQISNRTVNGLTWVRNSDGTITVNGTATAETQLNAQIISGLEGEFYFSGCPSGGGSTSYDVFIWDATHARRAKRWDRTTDVVSEFGGGNAQVYFEKGIDYRFCYRIRNGYTANNVLFSPMLRPASDTDGTYEPYNGNEYNISLASAGTVYGGTLDVVSGELTVDKVATVGLSSYTQASGTSEGGLSYYNYAPSNYKLTESGGVPTNISSHLAMKNGNTAWASATPCATANATRLRLYIEAGTESSYSDMVVVYTLANPLTYQLTAQEIKSLLGINNVWSDAGDTACEYRADTKLYIERLTEPDADMIADSNIVSGQYFMVGNSLYKATANIASGASVIVGTNAIRKSLSEALNEINS